MLERCNETVREHPDLPGPLSERSLVHSLRGDTRSACSDVRAALVLLESNSSSSSDPLLQKELAVRQATCRQLRTMDASG